MKNGKQSDDLRLNSRWQKTGFMAKESRNPQTVIIEIKVAILPLSDFQIFTFQIQASFSTQLLLLKSPFVLSQGTCRSDR